VARTIRDQIRAEVSLTAASNKLLLRMGENSRTICLTGLDAANNATGMMDDVRVSGFQAQSPNRKPGIHTRQDRELALGTTS
jgi:hypothetical protein